MAVSNRPDESAAPRGIDSVVACIEIRPWRSTAMIPPYPAFLSAVQNVANASGVGLTAWSPSPELPEEFYARVPMKLELVGRFHQIAKFFYGVGQLDRIINMENITLGEPKQDGEDVLLRAEGLATAFRALDEAKAKPSGDKRGAARKKGSK